MRLDTATALVTGANRGLRRHFVLELLARGATVYATARRPTGLAGTGEPSPSTSRTRPRGPDRRRRMAGKRLRLDDGVGTATPASTTWRISSDRTSFSLTNHELGGLKVSLHGRDQRQPSGDHCRVGPDPRSGRGITGLDSVTLIPPRRTRRPRDPHPYLGERLCAVDATSACHAIEPPAQPTRVPPPQRPRVTRRGETRSRRLDLHPSPPHLSEPVADHAPGARRDIHIDVDSDGVLWIVERPVRPDSLASA